MYGITAWFQQAKCSQKPTLHPSAHPSTCSSHLVGFSRRHCRLCCVNLRTVCVPQAELLRRPLVHIWRSPAYCQQLVQACFTQWMGPKQHVSTSSSITDHGSGNGTSSSHVSTGTLHARLAQQAHVGGDTAEQQYVLQPALLRLPHCQLKALLVASGRFGLLASEMREQQRHEDWQLQEQLHHQHEQQEEQLGQQARHDALRQQLQEALSGSPVPQQEHAAMITAVQPAQQTPATGSASQAAGCTSSLSTRKGLEHSCEPVGDSCHSMAAAFITTVLNEITPAVLAGWRADLVLALLWSAARLKVQVSQQLLQAGAAVMRAGLRQQIAARELVLLMWTAAALKVRLCMPNSVPCHCELPWLCSCDDAHSPHPRNACRRTWGINTRTQCRPSCLCGSAQPDLCVGRFSTGFPACRFPSHHLPGRVMAEHAVHTGAH